jgi:hypothetical protein
MQSAPIERTNLHPGQAFRVGLLRNNFSRCAMGFASRTRPPAVARDDPDALPNTHYLRWQGGKAGMLAHAAARIQLRGGASGLSSW